MALQGITRSPKDQMSGTRRMWMKEFSEDNFEITGNVATPSATGWVLYEYRKETSGSTTEAEINDPEGILFYRSDITLKISGVDEEKVTALEELMMKDLSIIVETNNDQYFAYGVEMPATSTAYSAGTGVAYGDSNATTITLQDVSRKSVYVTSKPATQP